MEAATLDYAARKEFDVGRFVARYFQVLAWLSIVSMISSAIFFDRLRIDLTPIFLFWAASALKRRSQTARKWVLAICGLSLGVIAVWILCAIFLGTHGMTVSFGRNEIHDPALWQVAAIAVPVAILVGVPFVALMSERARRQFALGSPKHFL